MPKIRTVRLDDLGIDHATATELVRRMNKYWPDGTYVLVFGDAYTAMANPISGTAYNVMANTLQ